MLASCSFDFKPPVVLIQNFVAGQAKILSTHLC